VGEGGWRRQQQAGMAGQRGRVGDDREAAAGARLGGVPLDLRAKAAREQLEDAALALARASGNPVLNGGYGAA
jgi:hypothetical protein